MSRVVIGMDPHKRSATIEVLDGHEQVLGSGRYGTDRDGYRQMLAAGRRWKDRVWAVEGCGGVGRPLAQRLVADLQARELLATVRPRDIAGRTRRRLAAELITELATLDRKLKDSEKQLRTAVEATGTDLLELYGLGPIGAARLLGDVVDITRFPTRNHFASWNGTAPLDASSGDHNRHRLSRAGNRRINRVLHIMAIVQIRNDTEGRAFYQRKLAEGKTPMEAIRSLKRRLSDVLYRQLIADTRAQQATLAKVAEASPLT